MHLAKSILLIAKGPHDGDRVHLAGLAEPAGAVFTKYSCAHARERIVVWALTTDDVLGAAYIMSRWR